MISRRQFGKRAALVASAGTVTDSLGGAAPLPANDQAAVDSKFANVIRNYGARLSVPQRDRVRRTLVEHQRMLMRIRDFELDNSDAPATGLRLYPTGGKGGE